MKLIIEQDKEKAKSLKNIATITLNRLQETNKEKYPSNTLKDYYDILKSLMEALNFIEGIKFKGDAAHYETIEHISLKYNLIDSKRRLLQNLRDYRNKISYEGFNIKESFIKLNSKKIESIIQELLKLIENKLKL